MQNPFTKKKSKKPKGPSPEEILRRKRRAKLRFKAVARIAYSNRYWLNDVADEVLGDNVHRNVAMLLKKRKGAVQSIPLQIKILLNKKAADRTEEEKYLLDKILGGLVCFRKYPQEIKTQLSAATYYKYFPPGRVIVKQGHPGLALYFIISGEVKVTQEVFDTILNETILSDLGVMGPGLMFGEVSLLHDIDRTATVTTLTHCEFLVLYKKDFEEILKYTIEEQWNQIMMSMNRFNYFDLWDNVTKREFCVIARVITYHENEVICGGKKGVDFVYFILSGQCQIIERIPIITKVVAGKIKYKVFNREEYIRRMSMVESALAGDEKEVEEQVRKVKIEERSPGARRKRTMKEFRKSSAYQPRSSSTYQPRQSSIFIQKQSRDSKDNKEIQIEEPSLRKSSASKTIQFNLAYSSLNVDKKRKQSESPANPPNLQKIFMQVCVLSELGCFGLNRIKHRNVIAKNEVTVLRVPKYWILERTQGNVWGRLKHYMDSQIPSSKHVFNAFVRERQWISFKKDLVKDMLKHRPPVNNYSNVPFSIRVKHCQEAFYEEL